MKSPSRASTAAASTTTGPSPPTRGRTCSSRAIPRRRTRSSCSSSAAVIKAVDELPGSAARVRRQRGQRPPPRRQRGPAGHRLDVPGRRADRDPRGHRERSTPTIDKEQGGDGAWACTSCRTSPRTPPTATAPRPSPSPATSSSSACSAPPSPSPGRNIVLNTIVAEELRPVCRHAGEVRTTFTATAARAHHASHPRAPAASSSTATTTATNGWQEAEKRGLLNLRTTAGGAALFRQPEEHRALHQASDLYRDGDAFPLRDPAGKLRQDPRASRRRRCWRCRARRSSRRSTPT